MEYNSSRGKLLMPQYGRNVQKMVEYLLTIEDREKRLQQARLVIELMSLLTPHLKTMEDYEHKLWDHLHQMTDYRLDVDGPFPPPTEEQLLRRPDPLPYPQAPIKHRHLGRNLQNLIDKGLADDPEKRQGYAQSVGYYMKLAYTNWHKEAVHDDMVRNELNILTQGELRYEASGYKVPFDPRASFQTGKNNNYKKNKNRKNGNGNGNNGGGKNNNNKNRNFKNK
jgi:hypothetical protein